jgi:predicted nuclease with TOPRIM domain
MEFLKFDILTNFVPFEQVKAENVYNIMQNGFEPDNDIHENMSVLKAAFITQQGREPNLEETKNLQSCAYAANYEEDEEENDNGDSNDSM